jgi:mRNA interferase MazF
MNRGCLVSVATPGDYGKPRPALIVQTNLFLEHPSITVCLITSHQQASPLYRYHLEPSAGNGLQVASQVQIDKIMTVPREKIGATIGQLTDKQMSEITKLLTLWIGIAE